MPAIETKPVIDNFVKVISPDRLMEAERRKRAEEEQSTEMVQSLASDLRRKWQAAYTARNDSSNELGSIEERLIKCLRQRLGQYDPDVYAEIQRQGRSDIFMLLTSIKCRAGKAWIEEIMLPPDEPVFDLLPTPVPDLPVSKEMEVQNKVNEDINQIMMMAPGTVLTKEIVQEHTDAIRERVRQAHMERARAAAEHIANKIEDEFQEGGFYSALKDFIDDVVTFPFAVMGGPFIRKERRVVWAEDGKGGFIPKIKPKFIRKYERVSPFDAYPSPGAKSMQDGYLFIRRKYRKTDLYDMIGIPGFSEDSIREVLANPPAKEWVSIDNERDDAYNRDEVEDPDTIIDVLEFWGNIEGKLLNEWGMEDIEDPEKMYGVTAWMIGNYVICARVNPHPLNKRPYHSTSYENLAGSIIGKSPPELMKDVQRMANAAARAIVDNLGIASGPQVGVNVDRMAPGTDVTSLYPWKVWSFEDDPTGSTGNPPFVFFQPNALTGDLWNLYERASIQAGEQTGIPAFTHAGIGANKEAGETASGMSMQINQAGKVLKSVVREIDHSIVKPIVKDHWMHIMLYDEDEYKIGDVNIVARASEHLIVMETIQLRLNEFMALTVNDWDRSIIGDRGRAALLRERIKALKIPHGDVIPTDDEMKERAEMQMQLPQGVGMPGMQPETGGKFGQAGVV